MTDNELIEEAEDYMKAVHFDKPTRVGDPLLRGSFDYIRRLASRVRELGEELDEVRRIVAQEADTFFICEQCGHQHDNHIRELDIFSMLEDVLKDGRR